GRQTPAFRALHDWVQQALASNPHLREEAWAPPVRPLPGPAPAAPPEASAPRVPGPLVEANTTPPVPPATTPAAADPPAPAVTAKAPEPAGPADPFDPEVFNRQMHPERKPE